MMTPSELLDSLSEEQRKTLCAADLLEDISRATWEDFPLDYLPEHFTKFEWAVLHELIDMGFVDVERERFPVVALRCTDKGLDFHLAVHARESYFEFRRNVNGR